jgi:hypothetical protein
MPLTSVTRLRLRSPRFLPAFLLHTWRSARQAQRSSGYLAGYFALGSGLTFWTVTTWADAEAMRAYRNGGAHVRAMPRLIGWCSEASVAHWEQGGTEPPLPTEAARRLGSEGKLSKVRQPTAAHVSGATWPDAIEPRRPIALPKMAVKAASYPH